MKQLNYKKGGLFLLLFLFCLLNIAMDYAMTDYALGHGYYETNRFTSMTSPLFHMVILISILSMIFMITYKSQGLRKNMGYASFILFGLIWAINNTYSIMIL